MWFLTMAARPLKVRVKKRPWLLKKCRLKQLKLERKLLKTSNQNWSFTGPTAKSEKRIVIVSIKTRQKDKNEKERNTNLHETTLLIKINI